jgi:hypothetical protein
MLLLGLTLTVLGVLEFRWTAKWLGKHMLERPTIFLRPILGKLVRLLWFFFLVIGLYLLWQVDQAIVFAVAGTFILIAAFTLRAASVKTKAKTIMNLYEGIRKALPQASQEKVLEQTARKYLAMQGWGETRVDSIAKSISDGLFGTWKLSDIQGLAVYLLYQVHPSRHITSRIEAKIEKAVSKACLKKDVKDS